MKRRVQVYRIGVFYKTSIKCHRASETGGGGFESAIDRIFYVFLDTR